MSLTITPRGEAGLPDLPDSIGHRDPSSFTGVTVHHQGGAWSSWLGLHQWQTAGRPPSTRLAYAGYSHGIDPDAAAVAEIRGWDRQPAGDHDNTRLQLVIGGDWSADLPPAPVLDAVVAYMLEARQVTGRGDLAAIPHADVWPAGHRWYSSCPGDQLAAWVRDTLPGLLDGDQAAAPAPRPPAPATRPAPGPPVAYPLPAGHYFGPSTGGARSVSGVYARAFGSRAQLRRWLQQWARQLQRRGWNAREGGRYLTRYGNDGIYGPEYRALAEAFQRDQGLTVDGLIGPQTWRAAYHNPVT